MIRSRHVSPQSSKREIKAINYINYRPISLTCILCKVLEQIVASSLSRYFDQNDIQYDLQHGFRERRSCETQLIQLGEELAAMPVIPLTVDK